MNILVTGANGQLGNEMRIVACGSNDRYIFTDINQVEGVETTFLDITDMEAVRSIVSAENIDAVVNCAAYTNVDAAETNESLAEKLNAQAPENLAKAMKEVGGLLVQISTDYVFGKAFGVCNQWRKVGHRTNAQKDKRRINAKLNTQIQKV